MRKILAILLFVAAAALAGWYGIAQKSATTSDPLIALANGHRPAEISPLGFYGSEKKQLLDDPAVQKLLDRRFGIVNADLRKAGSLDMMAPAVLAQKPDFLFGTQVTGIMANEAGLKMLAQETVFNTPIVAYSWQAVAEALVAQKLARKLPQTNLAYAVDFPALLSLIRNKTKWSDIGLGQLQGSVALRSTDPARSNSGNQLAGLMLQVLAGDLSDAASVAKAQSEIADQFKRMGYMEASTGDLFDQYLRQGMGAYPMIAAYETSLIEFAAAQGDRWTQLTAKPNPPVVLYLEPTVYSSHVILALSDQGRRFIAAMSDPEIQKTAWTRHGFRSGLTTSADMEALPIKGLPANIDKVVPMPPPAMIEGIFGKPTP